MTDEGIVKETEAGWILPLKGRRVTRCIVDFAFTLDFWISGSDSAFVRIEMPFSIGGRGGTTECDPASVASIAPALELFQCEVRSAVASRNGALELTFTDGQWLNVPPHNDYESWQVHLEGGALLVSQPGGKVDVWRREGTASPPVVH